MKVAIITASTAVYKGEQEDASGKVIRKMVEEAGLDVVFMKALPTDKDCTPEATMEVVDRPLLGIPEGMRAHMLTLTKRAMLNRAAAGIRGNVVIVNLPGKAGAVKECLGYILPEVMHAVEVAQGIK